MIISIPIVIAILTLHNKFYTYVRFSTFTNKYKLFEVYVLYFVFT